VRVVPGIGTTGVVSTGPAVLEAEAVVVRVVEVTPSGEPVEEATVVVSVVEVTPPYADGEEDCVAGPTGGGTKEETEEENELSVFVALDEAVVNIVVVAMDACDGVVAGTVLVMSVVGIVDGEGAVAGDTTELEPADADSALVTAVVV